MNVILEVDSSVSSFLGESVLIRYDNKNKRVVLGPLKEEAYKEYKEKIAKRKEIIKLLWQTLEEVGDDKVYVELHKLLTSEGESK